MPQNKFFSAEIVAEGVTLITGPGMVYCYLVEGREKALLIDTLCGIGSIAAFCRELTDLPLAAANTHAHFDHCTGNFEFEEVHIHPADVDMMYAITPDMCEGYVESQHRLAGEPLSWEPGDVIKARSISCVDLYDGFVFDLGGREIEVIETPGHSRGSVCFLDREHRILFAGDCCNCNTIIFDVMGKTNATSVEEYLETLTKMKKRQADFDTFFISHGSNPIDKRCIDEAMECCNAIIAGTDDAEPGFFLREYSCLYAKARDERGLPIDGGIANIAYTKENIFRR